jgi:ABC-type multidrug transport system ATPase subunit
VLLVLSRFFGFYYTFDEMNQYHRLDTFPLLFVLTEIPLVIIAGIIHHNWDSLKKSERNSFLLFIIVPIAGIIIQFFVYGVSVTTIANNISFGVTDRNHEAIVSAAKLADVDSNIQEFGLGYETVLGERGVTVSGGQKQRISIARALMKQAPILILDDSVSAVDTKTERVILDNLKKTRAGKTTILIAHRISTVEQMDKIVFIDQGRLVAVGSHGELYRTCEDYRRMVDLQKLEEEGGDQNA